MREAVDFADPAREYSVAARGGEGGNEGGEKRVAEGAGASGLFIAREEGQWLVARESA